MSLPTCPKCGCQLEVSLKFASGPKSAAKGPSSGPVGQLLEECEAQSLNQWEADFVGKLRERYDQYGERTLLSEKQRGILDKIIAGER